MAIKKIGKLSYRMSPDGLLFRWGEDGDVKRINLGPLNRLGEPKDDRGDYDDRGYDGDYEDVYDSDSRYGNDRYDDYDDYDDRRGYDDGYDDRRDDYDDRYDDDYDRRYDDRYEQPNDDEPYYEPGYEDDERRPSPLDAVWDVLDRYPWIIYVLLVLLPPLGIYLLWRQGMFDFTIRTAISVVSGIWFVVVLLWLFTGMTGAGNDPTTAPTPGINLASPSAEATKKADKDDKTAAATKKPAKKGTPKPTADPNAEPTAEPKATALASADQPNAPVEDAPADTSFVFSPTTGAYYHKTSTCSSIGTTAVTQVSLDVAEGRNQSQCPTCYGSTTYYMTDGGKHYHSDATCNDMKNAQSVTKSVATKAGKTACPDCVREFYISSTSPYYHSKSNCSGIANASQTTVNAATAAGKTACPTCVGTSSAQAAENAAAEASSYAKPTNKHDAGVIVYAKKGGSNYHRSATCTGSGMSGGQKITLYNAIDLGYTACKHCLPDGNNTVYADKNGKRYHSTGSCSAASSPVKTSLGKALAVGANKCSKCWGTASDTSGTNSSTGNAVTASGPKVYITTSDNHYHTRKACNGIDDPTKISLREAMAMGRSACNDCAGQANHTVYAASGDSKYHYSSSCSKLKGKAAKGTLAMALADELDPCSACVNNSTSDSNSSAGTESGNVPEEEIEDAIVDKSGISVYITQHGSKYHSSTSCTELGAEEYFKVGLGVADAAEKSPCNKCCATASHRIYSSGKDTRYHFDKNCSLLPGTARGATLARALMDGLKACPACTSDEKDDDKASISATPAPEVIPVSQSVSGKKVYATKNGSKYHISKTCSKIGNLEVKGISMETAKNYDLSACSTCSSILKRKVYGNDISRYYHSEKTCDGVKNDESGTLEEALLAGLKACPKCISGSASEKDEDKATAKPSATKKPSATQKPDDKPEADPTKKPEQSAPEGGSAPGTTKVYIDITDNSEVYHKSSKCSKLGDATRVTLSYVVDMGFDACGKCNPPTSISD